MIRQLILPDSGAEIHADGRRSAASVQRNVDAILDVLGRHAPKRGRALEIASGSGQHISRFAGELSGIDWFPSDADPETFASIEAWRRHVSCANLNAPLRLDATRLPWPTEIGSFHLVVLINLFHLLTEDETDAVLRGVSTVLKPGGSFILYGPFRRAGRLTSEGDVAFDAQLQAQDPRIGYKDDNWVRTRAADYGLGVWQVLRMPANNLAFVFRTAS